MTDGVFFALAAFFEVFFKARAFRAAGKGPVRIRATVGLRLLRTGPEATDEASGAGAMGISEVEGVGVVAVMGLRVYSWRTSFARR
jgi:hypothetical protein